jgi:hypothetical protein
VLHEEVTMRRSSIIALGVAVAIFSVGVGCGEEEFVATLPAASPDHPAPWDPDTPYEPGVDPTALQTAITNPLFPAPVGGSWTYEGRTDEGTERISVSVLEETRDVWGATATVIRDTVFLDGQMIEDTWDWYAQDASGNVWYLGEDTTEYENGEPVCDCGAWEAGVDGALPGIFMLAEPRVGVAYRQEYYEGEAEDLAEVVEVGLTITVAAGTFEGCIKTRDLSAIDLSVEEFKYTCPGVGFVLEEVPEDDERIELIEYSGLGG